MGLFLNVAALCDILLIIYYTFIIDKAGEFSLIFEWDENKNEANRIRHGVSFQEAETVFDDKNAVFLYDSQHSVNEERFIIIGLDALFRELTVCHCYRGKDEDIVRIISARKATKNERTIYYGGINNEG